MVPRYSTAAIAMHWLAALMILCALVMGVYMTSLDMSPTRLKLYNWHKWLGISILVLSAVRLLWRIMKSPPDDIPMGAWQRKAAHLTHGALYVLFFAVPLSGWMYSTAAGFPVVVFGLIPLPDLVAPDKVLAPLIKQWHEGLALALGALVVLHVAAALKHQLVDRDGLLSRMLPGSVESLTP